MNFTDPVSEDDFYEKELPDNIGPNKWKDLARALGFRQASINIIQHEKGNSKECCIEVLVRWLQQKGKAATAGKLAEALTKTGLQNLADKFPIKPSNTNRIQDAVSCLQSDKIEDPVRKFCEQLISFLKEEVFKMENKIKELEEEVSRLTARNNRFQDGEKQKVKNGRRCHGKNKTSLLKRKSPQHEKSPQGANKNLTAQTKTAPDREKSSRQKCYPYTCGRFSVTQKYVGWRP
ncbi:ankyrin-2-like [Montipora capricornis]|uniref:ankyrin-2-like n=1 Tax=Montipora capricornis TaxID=246305 RepID=UPI0035F1D70C